MSPEVEAAIIAGGVGFLTLIGTLAAQFYGIRRTGRDTKETLREQRDELDKTLTEQRTRTLNERFATAADRLGADKPAAVRLAAVYAMAGLADDWIEQRQTCVDVLCAYLRMPYSPDPGEHATAADRLTFGADQQVRHTVTRVITAHLQPEAMVSWQGLNLDFTGVRFDRADFSRAVFSGGGVSFGGAVFSGQVSFSGARLSGQVSFDGAQFSGGAVSFDRTVLSGQVSFDRTVFSSGEVRDFEPLPDGQFSFKEARFSGEVSFDMARFSGGQVSFGNAAFSGGQVSFAGAAFSGGEVDFGVAVFSGSVVSFQAAEFTGRVLFNGAGFFGGEVDFDAEFSAGKVTFGYAEFSGGKVSFERARFSGGEVDFTMAAKWTRPPTFDSPGAPPPGVTLPDLSQKVTDYGRNPGDIAAH